MNTTSTRRLTLAAALALFATTPVLQAQPRMEIALSGSTESFDADGGSAASRRTLAGALGAEYLFGERGRIFYALDAGDFSTAGDWTYVTQRAGAVYAHDLPAGARVFLGVDGTLRGNGDSWSEADFRALGGMANLELRPAGPVVLRLGYRLDVRRFPDLALLDQTQHDGFASVRLNLQTRTSVIAEAHLGSKSYEGDPGLLAAPAGRSNAGQAYLLARVAQSLADRTGVSAQVWTRRVWGQVPALVAVPSLFFDDGVYDDPFASEALGWRAGLKHVRPGGATLEVAVDGVRKDYTGAPALDAEGVPLDPAALRADRILRASAAGSIPLLSDRTGPFSLQLQARYDFTRHRSNDASYRYTAHAVTAGFSLEY